MKLLCRLLAPLSVIVIRLIFFANKRYCDIIGLPNNANFAICSFLQEEYIVARPLYTGEKRQKYNVLLPKSIAPFKWFVAQLRLHHPFNLSLQEVMRHTTVLRAERRIGRGPDHIFWCPKSFARVQTIEMEVTDSDYGHPLLYPFGVPDGTSSSEGYGLEEDEALGMP